MHLDSRLLKFKIHEDKPLQCIAVLSKMNSSIMKLINIVLLVQIVKHGILFAIWILQTCYHLPSFWIFVIDQVVNRLNWWFQYNCVWSLEVNDIESELVKDRTIYFEWSMAMDTRSLEETLCQLRIPYLGEHLCGYIVEKHLSRSYICSNDHVYSVYNV